MTVRTACLTTAALLAFGSIAAPSARAAYTITFTESDGNVLESGGGSFDLTGLARQFASINGEAVSPRDALFSGGLEGQPKAYYRVPITDPEFWGTGGRSVASSSAGDKVGIVVRARLIIVPFSYESGQPLSENSVYDDSTFESLGLTPGSYVESWGSGATADSFTVIVSAASPVPEPSTWAMTLIGFAGLGFAAYRQPRRLLSSSLRV